MDKMDEERQGLVGKKLELTVDEVVEEYVGSFGFSQLLQVILVSLAWIFEAQSTLVTIFTDAQPESWRCLGLDCGGIGGGDAASVCGLKQGTWEWNGGNKRSIIAEWGLVCDRRFLAALPASVYFLGSLIGPTQHPYNCFIPITRLLQSFIQENMCYLNPLPANRLCSFWSLSRCISRKKKSGAGFVCTNLHYNFPHFPRPQHMGLLVSSFHKWVFPSRDGNMLPRPLNRGRWQEMARSSRPIRVLLLCNRVSFNSLDCLSNKRFLEEIV